MRTAIPATWVAVTVFSLSVNTYVGAPPSLRSVTSNAASTEGSVLSRNASTTRNRDQASHAQNSTVAAPPILGPSPKSYCHHIPGSVTHGRCTRTRPARCCARNRATARRVVRSEPSKPKARSLAWATSARNRPLLRSIHSSSLGMNGSTSSARATGRPETTPPASRTST